MKKNRGKKGKAKLAAMREKFIRLDPKKDFKKTGIKTAADVVLGLGGGSGLALIGGTLHPSVAPIVGVLTIGIGHYLGDKTGITQVLGASMFGYGLAKVMHKDEPDESVDGFAGFADKAKRRLGDFKNEWMKAFFIDKLMPSSGSSSETEAATIDGFGAIDLSALDAIEESVKQSAISHEMNSMDEQEDEEERLIHMETSNDDFDEESEFAEIVEDEIDLSTI